MRSSVDEYISKARRLDDLGPAEEAMVLANELVGKYPDEMRAWALRAQLHTLARDYAKANSDLDSAIGINEADPYLYFLRGLNHLALGGWETAAEDFTRGLRLRDPACEKAFRFARAEALIGLGRKREAMVDLATLPEGYKLWTNRLRTKAELVSECTG
jgi:tetratricopeptide (TPR) repeat protein